MTSSRNSRAQAERTSTREAVESRRSRRQLKAISGVILLLFAGALWFWMNQALFDSGASSDGVQEVRLTKRTTAGTVSSAETLPTDLMGPRAASEPYLNQGPPSDLWHQAASADAGSVGDGGAADAGREEAADEAVALVEMTSEEEDLVPAGSRRERRRRRLAAKRIAVESSAAQVPAGVAAKTPAPNREKSGVMSFRREELQPPLPQALTRAQIIAGLRGILPRARRCVSSDTDHVTLSFSVRGSTGRVTRSSAGGELAGTVAGNCVARSIRRARFPRFQDEILNIRGLSLRIR